MRTLVAPRTPQRTLVLEHLKAQGSITQGEASLVYRIRRLSARIMELRDEGWDIDGEWDQDLTGQRFMRYTLVK